MKTFQTLLFRSSSNQTHGVGSNCDGGFPSCRRSSHHGYCFLLKDPDAAHGKLNTSQTHYSHPVSIHIIYRSYTQCIIIKAIDLGIIVVAVTIDPRVPSTENSDIEEEDEDRDEREESYSRDEMANLVGSANIIDCYKYCSISLFTQFNLNCPFHPKFIVHQKPIQKS